MIDMFPYEGNLVLNFPFSTSHGFVVGGVGQHRAYNQGEGLHN